MGSLGEVLVGLAILTGLVGIVAPIFPGLILIVGAVTVWAAVSGGWAWLVALAAFVLAGAGTIVKYAIPKRQLSKSGVPNRTLVLATLVAVVGFFIIPVIGAVIGFMATVYIFEYRRVGRGPAWPATKSALRAVATSIGIELAAGVLIGASWLAIVLFS